VTASSWDTWLDGYVPGAPYRKTNIYDEGNLIALMLDTKILQATNNQKSLRDVCVLLYTRYGKQNKGYTESDIIAVVSEVMGQAADAFFKEMVYEAVDYETGISQTFEYLGWHLVKQASVHVNENVFGFKAIDNNGFAKVSLVAPYSPAWQAGLFQGDDILAVNKHVLRNNLQHWLNYHAADESIRLTVNKADTLHEIVLKKDPKGRTFFFNPLVKINTKQSESQIQNYKAWKTNQL
jgi:predicted metalloprotease with PDZ domain